MTKHFPNYRFLLTAGALIALFTALAEAQTRPARDGREAGPPQLQRLEERIARLNLTDDQKVQFQAIKDEIAETVQDLGKGLKDLPPAERRQKLQAALGDVREKFLSILTPEQKKQFQADARQGPRANRPLAQEQPGEMMGGDTMGGDMRATTQPDAKADPKADANKPAARRAASGGEPPMLARLRESVEALDLTPEQKTKVDAIFQETAEKVRELRKEAAGNERGAMREKVQDLTQGLREKLAAVLTPEQREKLKETLPARGEGRRALEGQRKAADPPATRPADANATTPNAAAAKAAVSSSADALAIGSPAPAFTLTRLNGTELSSKSLLGKPTVLAFGSLSSPSFRDRLPKLEQLKNKYRSRANVIVVYTKEAHPSDGWQVDRNRDAKLDVAAPTTTKDRIALATKLRDLSKTTVDIAVDDIADSTLKAFGDKPQGAIVLSPTGLIAGVQTFCDPSGLARMIDESFKMKASQADEAKKE